MKIGILGLDWDIGIPLALTLRDYGRHSVIAYGELDQAGQILRLCDPPPEREVQTLLEQWGIPITDRMQLFAEYCDLVYICQPDLVGASLAWLDQYRQAPQQGQLPLVVACPLQTPLVLKAWNRGFRWLDFGYQPCYIDRSNGIDRLANPAGPIYVAGSEHVHTWVEMAWRPVVNTIPVRRVPLGYQILPAGVPEGTVVGSPVATERLGALLGDVDNPPPVENQRRTSRDRA